MPDENNPGTQKFRRTQVAHDGVISDMPLCRRNLFQMGRLETRPSDAYAW